MQLTAEQKAVVYHQQGHARIRAVAGSGKTTTLVARVIHLLRQGINPQRLLVVMYNKAAQQDFTAKLVSQAQHLATTENLRLNLPQIRTFHSLGYKLSQSLNRWGYLPARQLIQHDWQLDKLTRQALTQLAQEQGIKAELWLEEDVLDEFKSFCTLVKSSLASPKVVFDELDDSQPNQQHFVAAFNQLEDVLATNGVKVFDDLIWLPAKLLAAQPAIKQRLEGYLSYLIVDEYQDINPAQQSLIKALAGDAELMVVGDVDQCIYAWRGAKPEFMLNQLEKDFSPLIDYPLSHTFRFGHSLALAANAAINNNQQRTEQLTLAPKQAATQIEVGSGSQWLLNKINKGLKELHQAGKQHAKAAILVRSWAQSLDLQLDLLANNQTFTLSRPEHFIFQRNQVQAVLAYAHLALYIAKNKPFNLYQALANYPNKSAIEGILGFPTLYLSLNERHQLAASLNAGEIAFNQQLAQLTGGKQKRIETRLKVLASLSLLVETSPPAKFISSLLTLTKAEEILRKTSASKEAAEESLRLIKGLAFYASQSLTTNLEDWLNELNTAQTQGQLTSSTNNQPSISLTTVHSAKGLEWDVLGIYALNEGDFPYNYTFNRLSLTQLEAERRLFYVALTRAKHQLYLASNQSLGEISRFLLEAEINEAKSLAELLSLAANNPEKLPKQVAVSQPELVHKYWHNYYPNLEIQFVAKPKLV